MKYFLITITFLLLFGGCSYQNAFSKFGMTQNEELLASYTQSTKIESKDSTEGVLTAIYLNHIDEIYQDGYENFLIGVYLKDSKQKYDFILNNTIKTDKQDIVKIKFYKNLVKTPRKWDTYYVVRFKNYGKKVNLSLKGSKLSSSPLNYLKDPL